MNQSITNEEANKKMDPLINQLLEARSKLAELKKEIFRIENVENYEFGLSGGEKIKLEALFGDKDQLILVHNMGRGCTYCTLWADGFNGVLSHLENRAAFVVSSPDAPEIQKEFAESRSWKFPMVSTEGTSFAKDMGMVGEDDIGTYPGMSLFEKSADGKITRLSKDYYGPGDDYCSVWHMFGLLPEAEWQPKFSYGS